MDADRGYALMPRRAGGEEDGLAPPGGVGQGQAGVDGHAAPRAGELVVAEGPPDDEAVVVAEGQHTGVGPDHVEQPVDGDVGDGVLGGSGGQGGDDRLQLPQLVEQYDGDVPSLPRFPADIYQEHRSRNAAPDTTAAARLRGRGR